jgi:fructuronate reductase
VKYTHDAPTWVHFSAGNLFKAYHAALAQTLVERGGLTGIIAVVPNDFSGIDAVWKPHDNLFMKVVMKADGSLENQVIASVTEILASDSNNAADWGRLKEIFQNKSLQMVSLSITEKGYDLKNMDGTFKAESLAEFDVGPNGAKHTMTKLAALMLERFKAGAAPVALVSTDNFSHNGDKLRDAVLSAATEWQKRGHVDEAFVAYLSDTKKVSFPYSMIDKITPNPSPVVVDALKKLGLDGMELVERGRGAPLAAFVNTEEAEYLVIEDSFPNGRPPLEKAGVYFCPRETVDKVERMKVCTCLNPLHTALAVLGCLLGYKAISAEMKDKDLSELVRKIGYDEGMPVVTNPGIIKPAEFLAEVLEKRFPNPNIPDTPQRIATDTSQKVGIRFGGTIKMYSESKTLDIKKLRLIPFVIAAWCRYLLALDDEGNPFTPSSDPLLADLQKELAGVKLGDAASGRGKLKNILSNEKIFSVDLYKAGIGELVENIFAELLAGPGAVRKTLQKYVTS